VAASLAERVYELRRDRRHGASWMARRAVEALVEAMPAESETSEELFEALVSAARELSHSRTEVGAVAGALGRIVAAAHTSTHLDPADLRRLIEEEAQGLISARDRAAASIAIQLRPRLEHAFVLTHSASATVRAALLKTPPMRVTCTVSAPNEEGRVFAEELREAGLEVDLVEDAEATEEIHQCSLLLLGADTVFRDGMLVNKVGTRRLAERAQEVGIPTVVAVEVIKLAPLESNEAPALDPEAAELFDTTPAELIDEFVTEEGTFRADDVRPLIDRTPFLREGYRLLRGV
jgi:translation initiation factor 2B subunit (eIF-2B alpha/beta/delta family)